MGKVKKRDGLTGGTNYGVVAMSPNPQADGLLGRWANRMRNAQKRIGSNGSSYLNTSEYRRMNGAQQEQFRALSPEGQARVINKGRAFQSATTNGEGYGTYIGRALKDARNRENRTSLRNEVSQTAPTRNSNRQARTSSTSPVQTNQPVQTVQPASHAQTRAIERESMFARAAKDSRKYKEWANLYIPQPPERKSEDFNWNQYAGSSRRIGQESKEPVKTSLKDTSAPAKQKATTYTIKKGDTLGSIAKRYGVDWRVLADANGIDDPNLVYAGVKLKIDPATMGKKNKRKVGVNRPRVAPPGMHAGERTFRTPTRAEATAINLPMNTGAINIDLPEDYY